MNMPEIIDAATIAIKPKRAPSPWLSFLPTVAVGFKVAEEKVQTVKLNGNKVGAFFKTLRDESGDVFMVRIAEKPARKAKATKVA